MVKRIIALILCLSLLPATIINAYAADTGLSNAAKEAYDVLSALEYINNDYSEDMIADISDFTRAEFAEMAFKVFGNGQTSSEVYFHDVPATHFAAEAIAALVEMNILSVGENKMFYPDNPITRTEAAKILLYAIGYDKMCVARGGWPAGVEAMAHDIKLYKNISSGNSITYADMLIMFYNALTSEILEMTGVEGGYPVFESRGSTYLSAYHNIYLGRGLLSGTNGVSIYGDEVLPDKAYIDDIVLELDGKNVDAYLGSEVQFLYSHGDKNELIWIKALHDGESLILNRYDNDPKFNSSADVLSYHSQNNKKKTVKVSQNLNIIFNGSYVTTGVSEILNSNFYEIKLLKSSRSVSAYDIAIISDFENYHIVSLPNENTIYLEACDASIPNRSIIIDSYEKIDIITPDGTSLKPAEIPFDNIISVFESKDKKAIKLVVSSNSISGKIDSISYDDEFYYYTVNGVDYIPYKTDMGLNCRLGEDVVFLLDMNGRIAMVDEGKISNNFAYLIETYYNGSGLSKGLYIKMYSKSGGVKEYTLSEKTKIDGVKYKDLSAAFEALGGNEVKPQIIAFELDSEGNIIMIDLPAAANDTTIKTRDNMLVKNEEGSKMYDNLSMRLGQRTIMNSNSVIFGVPGNVNTAEDKEYATTSVSNLEFERTYEYVSYSYTLDDEFFYSDVLSIRANFGVEYWVSTRVAVSDIKVAKNDDDEFIYVVGGYHGSDKKEIKLRTSCTPNPNTLHKGDVISVSTRVGDEITAYKIAYCPHTDPHTHATSNTGYGTGGAFEFVGYIYDIKDKAVKISYEDPAVWGQIVSLQNCKILLYEEENAEDGFKEVTPAELLTYRSAGNDCDKVYVYMNSSQMRNFIIFR